MIIVLGFLVSLTPWVSSAIALLLGVTIALTLGNPHLDKTRKWTRPLLSISIIALGAGMNLLVVAKAGLQGIGFTFVALSLTLVFGFFLAKWLKIEKSTGLLINIGTAICGGSAIAAVTNAIRAKPHETSVALAVVFLLNALALFLFPPLGHFFHLTEDQFGLWSALAIHDTSSVVGATLQYGPRAVEVGTTIKLVRALWIIPITLAATKFYRPETPAIGKEKSARPPYPWFILGFLLMSAFVTWFPAFGEIGHGIEFLGHRALTATLFLIGAGLTRATLQKVGVRPLIYGVTLWFVVGAANLVVILLGN